LTSTGIAGTKTLRASLILSTTRTSELNEFTSYLHEFEAGNIGLPDSYNPDGRG
jgi:hypothetical protein